jgi:hypothetical protein
MCRADNFTTIVYPAVLKSGSMNLLESSGPAEGLLEGFYYIVALKVTCDSSSIRLKKSVGSIRFLNSYEGI